MVHMLNGHEFGMQKLSTNIKYFLWLAVNNASTDKQLWHCRGLITTINTLLPLMQSNGGVFPSYSS